MLPTRYSIGRGLNWRKRLVFRHTSPIKSPTSPKSPTASQRGLTVAQALSAGREGGTKSGDLSV